MAERLAPALTALEKRPVYVDCNAVSPQTAIRIADIVAPTGADFVDGGIIGPPPEPDSSKTRIYLSGPDAEAVAVLGIVWGCALMIGATGMISSLILAHINTRGRRETESLHPIRNGKPVFDPDAFDVVSNRG